MRTSKEQPKRGQVLMFSGGMDSYLAYKLFDPKFLVFCAARHRYQDREAKAIEQLGLRGLVIVDQTLDLSSWERADAIIPLRNLLFAAVGSRYADTVWLGSLLGEGSHDKTPDFYRVASSALRQCYLQDEYWCDGRTVYVESPVASFTKARLLRRALVDGVVTREEVGHTVSCYQPGGFCGRCASCFKRAVATKLNGWVEEYEVDPFSSEKAVAARERLRTGYYHGERRKELEEVFGL